MPQIYFHSTKFRSGPNALRLTALLCSLVTIPACREGIENPSVNVLPKPETEPPRSSTVVTTIPVNTSFTPAVRPSSEPVGSEGPVAPAPTAGAAASEPVPVNAPVPVPANPGLPSLPLPTADNPSDTVPPPAAKSVRNGRYFLRGVASERCLDMPFGDESGYPLILWDCSGSKTQIFTFEHVSGSYFKIYSPYLRIVEVRGGSSKLGEVLQQGDGYVDGNYQQFEFELQVDKQTYTIKIHSTDLAWEVSGGGTGNGVVITAGKLTGSSHERFFLIPVP